MPEHSHDGNGDFVPPEDSDFTPPTGEEFVPPSSDPAPPLSSQDNGKKWIIPVVALGCGCICLPLVAIALGLLGLGNTARRIFQSTGTYQVYQIASEAVETDPEAIAALGAPVEAGWTSKSEETYNNETGQVCMRFSVAGDDRSGSAYAEAQSVQGAWQLHQLVLSINGEPEPTVIVPLEAEAQSLCPDFDAPDPEFDEETEPDRNETIPAPSTEI